MKPQTERVLRQLRLHPEGVNQTAFSAPWVIDQQKPIQRVAARVEELRREGYVITTRRLANNTATYRLISELAVGEAAADRAA
jgi:hypothetical protein